MDSAPILALDSDHVDNNDRRSSSFLRNCDGRHFSRVCFGVRVFRGYVLYGPLWLISVGFRVITTHSDHGSVAVPPKVRQGSPVSIEEVQQWVCRKREV